jgi:hypothetical protein
MKRITLAMLVATAPFAHATGALENPAPGAIVSGISVISGWTCDGTKIELELDGAARSQVSAGVDRADTASACGGKRNNGFGQLTNWSVFPPGPHTLRALADGVEFARTTFTITSLGAEYLRGKSASATVYDFPAVGKSTTLQWQEPLQSFVATEVRDDAPSLWGRWNGANIERRSNCASSQNNGQHGTYGQFDIANDGGIFTIIETAVTGLACTYNGTYSQDGTQRRANGIYFCSDGKQGDFTSTGFLVTPTEMQIRMDIKLKGSESCTIDAILGGSRF